MTAAHAVRPRAAGTIVAVLVLQGTAALVGGAAFLVDPSGGIIGIGTGELAQSPFDTFFVPGLILFVVLGVLPLIVAWGLWQGRRRWAWYGSLFDGVALSVWIVVEAMMMGLTLRPPLQPIVGALGLLIVGLTLTKPVISWGRAEASDGYRVLSHS